MAFLIQQVDGGRIPGIEYLPAGAITPKVGMALTQTGGNLAVASGTTTPTYISMVQPPHDKLYPAYLEARVDYANGEYEKYQNTMQMFNAFFGEFIRWFALTYSPADTHGEVYYGV